MAPPRRRFAKPLTSGRYLALRRGRGSEAANVMGESDLKDLPLGYKQLFSYYVPGLLGGKHKIHVRQSISLEPRDKTSTTPPDLGRETTQEFEVLAPRFELPADAVYSVYPEQGHTATHDTLPHVVFNDLMLPWERIGSFDAEEQKPPPADSNYNRVPWLACLVFTPDELQVDKTEMEGIFAQTSIRTSAKQMESMAVPVPVSDLLKLKDGTAKFSLVNTDQSTKPSANIIFPTAELFNGLFAAYGDDGKPTASPRGGPDVSRYRFLAHLMRMNTEGMAYADREAERTNREFSVIIANRVGPLVGDKPTQMIVHVVSLENLEDLKPFPILPTTTGSTTLQPVRVGLVSLFSWSYTSLPPNSLNVEDAFRHLGEGAQMLRPVLAKESDPDATRNRLIGRLQDGYTMVRYRASTGEETPALLRGPLTPTVVPPQDGMDMQSNTGTNLMILDKELGMMDLTYSTAWALGRTLALADRAYTIALTRVRHQIMKPAADKARRQMVHATSRAHKTKADLLKDVQGLVHNAVAASQSADDLRWKLSKSAVPLDLSYRGVSPFLEDTLESASYDVASSLEPEPEGWTLDYAPPYDEFNEPASPDWMIVFRFIMDMYYLINVPSHYLVTDQSMLPPESLRFFFIDHSWIDALVDGALSLGNHGGTDAETTTTAADADDPVRRAIKKSINRFFDEPLCAGRRPAIPRFGFYMRSAVVAQFPDLKVSVRPETKTHDGAPMLLRHEIIDKDTMLGFFSDRPIKEGLEGLRFELPAHQQYFSVGNVSALQLRIEYRRQYTTEGADDKQRNVAAAEVLWPHGGKGSRVYQPGEEKKDLRERSPVFVWGLTTDPTDTRLRLLLVDKLAQDLWTTLDAEMRAIHDGWFSEPMATSAMMGMQLSSPAWQLQIGNMPALAVAEQVGRIPGRLSYRPAPVPVVSLANVQTLASKTCAILPQYPTRESIQQGLLPPHINTRIHKTDYIPPPTPRAKATKKTLPSPTPNSWDLVPSTALDDPEADSDFEDLVLPPSLATADPVGLPKFDIHIASTLSPGGTTISLPSASRPETHTQDLILSIIYAGQGRAFALKALTISIPISSRSHANLLASPLWGATHPKMVSNLRFNVRASYSADAEALKLSLVPRSRKARAEGVDMFAWRGRYPSGMLEPEGSEEEIDLLERTELSVVLYNAKVRPYTKDVDVPVTFVFGYPGNAESEQKVMAKLRV